MKISIITATYNSAATVRDTLESVLQQTHQDWELIIEDGLSKDDTLSIVREYEPLCKGRMRIFSEKDNGIYDAMNRGIARATGEIIGILNSDDFYHRTDVFDIINKSFEENKDVQAIYGDVRFVHPDNLEKTVRYYSCKHWKPWRFRFGFMPAHPTFFTYKENFEKYGYYQYDYHIAADYELLIRHLYTNKVPAKYVPLDFMKMRTGGRSTNGWKANILLNREIVRGCKENGIWTCMPLLFLKYFIKVFELIKTHND